MNLLPTISPTDFVAICNQTLEIAYPVVSIIGEISNYRVSKGKWVYFDIKDDTASLKCFATTFNLRMPLEDGMSVVITARPQLHPLYNFTLSIVDVRPEGEGSIKKAADILKEKLTKEGIFSDERKRALPYPPEKIGLITSTESAAYGDFVKILQARWPIVEILVKNTKVQGSDAANEIVDAIRHFNQAEDVEVLVVIRGGGSADDLLAFQEENLVRAVAESRVPTLVAIGHERDVSLVELAADVRASTPSNAAEILAPSRDDLKILLKEKLKSLRLKILSNLDNEKDAISSYRKLIIDASNLLFDREKKFIEANVKLLNVLNPDNALKRGYSIVINSDGKLIKNKSDAKINDDISIKVSDGEFMARVLG